MSSIKDKLIADPSTGCFSVVLCGSCKKMKTHHRCLAPVAKGGMRYGMDDNRVCAMPICGPCNDELGNENIFRCYFHSESKENLTQLPSQNGKVPQKQNRAVEYSSKELLILSQAYIKTSENSIDGASQKKNKFWDDVADTYRQLKKHHEEYDQRQSTRKKFNDCSLRRSSSSHLSDSDTDDGAMVPATSLPPRSSSSLQQKWSKFIQPYVTKFIGLTNRYPKLSGEGNVNATLYYSYLFFSVELTSSIFF
jgi:hypothetical protein